MKRLFVLCCTFWMLLLLACNAPIDSGELVSKITAIKLVESPEPRTVVVNAHFKPMKESSFFQNVPLPAAPISLESSEIVITDTVGLKPGGRVEVVPSAGGLNVIIDANIQPGDYYCQSFENGKMTCERGQIGVHLNKANLTTIDSYSPAADHFASAAAQNTISIFNDAGGTVNHVDDHSTNGQTICVYNENGSLVVARKN